MPTSSPIEFELSYRLFDYVAGVLDIYQTILRKQAAAKGEPLSRTRLVLAQVLVTPICAVAFFLKPAHYGRCSIRISNSDIRRRSGNNLLILPWSEISAVYRCGRGLVLAKGENGISVPYRALSQNQRSDLLAIVAAHGLVME